MTKKNCYLSNVSNLLQMCTLKSEQRNRKKTTPALTLLANYCNTTPSIHHRTDNDWKVYCIRQQYTQPIRRSTDESEEWNWQHLIKIEYRDEGQTIVDYSTSLRCYVYHLHNSSYLQDLLNDKLSNNQSYLKKVTRLGILI
jgi:hypothetical protein